MKSHLLDCDPDELERRLIDSGRRDRAPGLARRRALASMTAAAGGGLAAASVSSGAVAAAPWLVATKWVAVGVAAGAMTLGVAERINHLTDAHREVSVTAKPASEIAPKTSIRSDETEPSSGAVAVPPAPEPVPSGAVDAPAALQPVMETSEDAVAVRRSSRRIHEGDERSLDRTEGFAPVATPAPSSTIAHDDGSLQREVQLLEQARRSLDRLAPADALRALDRYADEFPAGHMGIEARSLHIEALLAAGQRDSARALAQSFLASYPRSPVALRVRRLLDAADRGATNP